MGLLILPYLRLPLSSAACYTQLQRNVSLVAMVTHWTIFFPEPSWELKQRKNWQGLSSCYMVRPIQLQLPSRGGASASWRKPPLVTGWRGHEPRAPWGSSDKEEARQLLVCACCPELSGSDLDFDAWTALSAFWANLSMISGRGGQAGSQLALAQGYSEYLARLWGVSGHFGCSARRPLLLSGLHSVLGVS